MVGMVFANWGALGCRPDLLGALPQPPQGISSLDPSALRAWESHFECHPYQFARIARVMSATPSFTGAIYSSCVGSSTAGKVNVADVSP